MNIAIRPEQTKDSSEIRAVTEAAFSASPHGLNNEQLIVERLRSSHALFLSLVAELDGKVVGHVAVSPVQISDSAQGWFGLGPISVLPKHQAQGIGAKLMRQAVAAMKRDGAQGCVLVGAPEYYGRFGFNHCPSLVYPGIPSEYFLALKFGASFPVGSVTYHAAFAAGS